MDFIAHHRHSLQACLFAMSVMYRGGQKKSIFPHYLLML